MSEAFKTLKNEKGDAGYRIALGLEYDGTAYNGWQVQPHAPSVQAELAKAAAVVANEPVAVYGAGRTDTGVHATMQVAHFDTTALRSDDSWRRGINSHLPDDINVHWARPVDNSFSARFSAESRAYRYLILNRSTGAALDRARAWWVRQPLDVAAMQDAASCLIGEHDFSAFRASSCQAPTPMRCLTDVELSSDGAYVALDVRGNAFLHHMIRNITGTLVRVGLEEEPPEWVAEVLASRDRTLSGVTAPAHGLYFTDVAYPARYGLPRGSFPLAPVTGQLRF